ncbi:NUDIX hydrolase (plasmid) [Skermanella mucosa]|uniref:NUDIX hydrolase n=1 Tax=Skermanella mucosa TaxID=1789672 RepID=UPI00192BA7DC|nr:NUDIX hydrolase [Skermanella mucosa]UEM25046.1 NUDIX hydrolase [Skermanella mucosa]
MQTIRKTPDDGPKASAAPRPAATLILLRDAPGGLETLMIERHAGLGFAPGALVFPGGCLAAEDRHPTGIPGGGLHPARLAAIRETFEECGILLARRHDGALPDPARCADLVARYRARLLSGDITFGSVIEAEGLVPADDRLVAFGHWVTPAVRPRRFDTVFFIAAVPPGQQAEPDGSEIVSCRWGRPAEIIEAADAGAVRLIFATRMNLMRLATSRTVAEAVETAMRQPLVRIVPEWIETSAGAELRIPEGAGYCPCVVPAVPADMA